MTTMILFVGDAPSDQVAAVMRMATEINVAGEQDRLRERQELARTLVTEYRERSVQRARPVTPRVVEAVPAYAEELRAFAPPDWSGVILEYPYAVDEQPATPWGGINIVWNGK